jgi:hypothetical protein
VLLGLRAAPGVPVRRGGDWLTLSRRAVEVVARDRPRLLAHFRRTILPTEAYPHSVLYAEPGLVLSGDTRRFSSWTPGAAHPDTLGLDDLDRVAGADFARKFEDPRVLDELDRRLR